MNDSGTAPNMQDINSQRIGMAFRGVHVEKSSYM